MSVIKIFSAVAPSRAAIFSLIASTASGPEDSRPLSPVSIAVIVAARLSATNRIPSGPKQIGPADFSSGDPCFSSAAPAVATIAASANTATIPIEIVLNILGSFREETSSSNRTE